jgi:hypothetical protein
VRGLGNLGLVLDQGIARPDMSGLHFESRTKPMRMGMKFTAAFEVLPSIRSAVRRSPAHAPKVRHWIGQ